MKGGIYLAIASILHLECAAQIIHKSLFSTIALELSSAEHIGTEANGAKHDLHVFREASSSLTSSTGTVKGHRLLSTDTHELVFVVEQKNMVELTQILHDVSDPTSSNYGNHLTRQEVIDLTSNPHSHDEVVAYLTDAGATVIEEQLSVGLITARGEIGLWERMLNTEFYSYSLAIDGHVRNSQLHVKKFMRTDRYFVPSCLDEHIASILNAIDVPHVESGRTSLSSSNSALAAKSSHFSETSRLYDGYITPQLINNAYNIDDNTGHPRATQAAYAGFGNFFSPEDLREYQMFFEFPIQPVNQSFGSRSMEWCTNSGNNSCSQGNMDIQLMTSIADTPTIFYYTSLGTIALYLEHLVSITALPPLVISISYGIAESLVTAAEMDLFNVNAIILGTMGTTIVTAAGDDGVSSWLAQMDAAKCGYDPRYPASSPYVVSTGGTQVRPRIINCNNSIKKR